MGQHSQATLELGRRPSTIVSTRFTRTLAVATPAVCTPGLSGTASRYVLSSSFKTNSAQFKKRRIKPPLFLRRLGICKFLLLTSWEKCFMKRKKGKIK